MSTKTKERTYPNDVLIVEDVPEIQIPTGNVVCTMATLYHGNIMCGIAALPVVCAGNSKKRHNCPFWAGRME